MTDGFRVYGSNPDRVDAVSPRRRKSACKKGDAKPAKELTYEMGLKKATELLSVRERSVKQLRKRLIDYGYSEDVTSQVIDRLQEVHFLSDERYGAAFARSKLAVGWGIGKIRKTLAQEGIELDTLKGWPEEFIEDSEDERARELLAHAHFNSKNIMASAYRKLMSRGFSPDVCSRIAREYASNQK